jgi:hypothetical protein
LEKIVSAARNINKQLPYLLLDDVSHSSVEVHLAFQKSWISILFHHLITLTGSLNDAQLHTNYLAQILRLFEVAE